MSYVKTDIFSFNTHQKITLQQYQINCSAKGILQCNACAVCTARNVLIESNQMQEIF